MVWEAKRRSPPPDGVFQAGAQHQAAGERRQTRAGALGTFRTGGPQAPQRERDAERGAESEAEPGYVAISTKTI